MSKLLSACRLLIAEWQADNERGGEYDLDVIDRLVREVAAYLNELEEVTTTSETTELLGELVCRARRTGVIVGFHGLMSMDQAADVREQLEERFPQVVFAVFPGASSVAFEWDEDEP